MRAGLAFVVCAMAAGLNGLSAQEPPAQSAAREPDVSAAGVVRAAAAYLKTYQEQLTFLIADEAYTQQVRAQIPDDQGPKGRTMKSEMFFMFTPADRIWMAIRDVIEVDRQPVTGRQDLRAALETMPTAQVARTFKAHNSRLNIGRIQRNFNEPILSLLVVDPRYLPNFTFDRRRVERISGGALVTVTFAEKGVPTLITDLQSRPVFSKGEMVIEAATGRIRRAQLSVTIAGVTLELVTTFGPDERLGLWVPIQFRERYQEGVLSGGTARMRLENTTNYEEIVCEAKYTNYRRFETTARIKL